MDFITTPFLTMLLVGQTHYVDIGAAEDAVLYYRTDTLAHMTLPGGNPLTGDVHFGEDGYAVTWRGGPSGNWRIGHVDGQFVYVNGDGDQIGKVTRIVAGNAERY